MKSIDTLTLILTLLLLSLFSGIFAQQTDLTASEKQLVIDSVSSKLNSNYVFPDMAKKMADNLKSNLSGGNYNTINDPQEFAMKLTTDLQAISKDKHIRVSFAPQRIAEEREAVTPEDSIAFMNRYIARLKRDNFGFKEVKMLGGNVGYLDLRSFSNVEFAGETAVAAMNFLSNSDAIIIDLRYNGGGSPAMIQLISSYLFGSESVHLNNFYWRPSDRNTQTWTLPHVDGKRSPDTPVYVLTSASTFSAAEEFSYNLRNLERATLVGETTGGGAHPGGSIAATDRYMVWVPTGRAINPITNTNWEGTGVKPHIEVPADDALNVAHMEALKQLIENNKEEDELRAYFEWPMAELNLKSDPVTLDKGALKKFAGTYGPRKVTLKDDKLIYQRDQGKIYELVPYKDNEFMLIGLDYFRIRFIMKDNKVVALQGMYSDGRTDKNNRDNS